MQKKSAGVFNNPHPVDHRNDPDILERVTVAEVEGNANINDGIDFIFSPGRSPGGQSGQVKTETGRVIITGFCCNDKISPKQGLRFLQVCIST